METRKQKAPVSASVPTFSSRRTVKLGSFHIGSSMSDLITSAVWNRILIADLDVVAWPVALLSALRYFLAPLTLWAGHGSATHHILGTSISGAPFLALVHDSASYDRRGQAISIVQNVLVVSYAFNPARSADHSSYRVDPISWR